jgi:PAS domain S-box-containing protein
MRALPFGAALAAARRARTPIAIVVIGCVLTAIVTALLLRAADLRERDRFDRLVDRYVYAVRDHIETYTALLRATAGLFAADSGQTTREGFRRYVSRIELGERYPGIQGIGYSYRLQPGETGALEARMRREGAAGFRVWPETPRDEHHAILYLEPRDARNAVAIGFDMYSEPVRRAAMQAARDSGELRASGKVTLVQEIERQQQAGFLVYLPVYSRGGVPDTLEVRRETLLGFAYAAFRAGDLLRNIIAQREPDATLGIAVYDGDTPSPERLLYASHAVDTDDAVRARLVSLPVAGRTWTMHLWSVPGTAVPSTLSEAASLAAAFGLLTTLLLAALSQTQARTHAAERRHAERLAASERRYRKLFELAPAGVLLASPDWRVLEFNDRAHQSLGYPRERFHALSLAALQPPDGDLLERLAAIERDGESRFETRLRAADGEARDVVVAVQRLEGTNGQRLVVLHDITDHKRAARALAESERRLKTVYDVTPIGLAVADDASARFIRPNGTLARMLAVPPDANTSLTDAPRERLAGLRVLRDGRELRPEEQPVQVAASGRAVHGERIDLAFPDGRVLRLLAEAAPILDDEGRPSGAVAAFIDVGEREHLLESERAARAEAERANRIKDEFLATVSHELRTPLNAILGWARILRRRKPPFADPDEGLAIIERNARAQAQLIDDLLETSRIVAGKVRLDLEALDLAELVAGTVESVRPTAEAKGVQVRKRLPQGAALVRGDARRLQQIAWNLLTNAIKFTDRNGTIDVSVSVSDKRARLEVSDTGAGIDPDFLPQLFDRFRQADSSTTRRHGGLGLGLSIVRHLTELHGGEVRAASDGPGCGATFVVELPLQSAYASLHTPAGNADAGDHEAACERLDGVRVLVVDDEADARGLVEQLLRECDAITLHASSSAEALDVIARERPDVLVSDIGMPGEDGYALIRKLRRLPPAQGGDLPAAALTSFTRPEDRERALAAGYQVFLTKPVVPSQLIGSVARLTGRSSQPVA